MLMVTKKKKKIFKKIFHLQWTHDYPENSQSSQNYLAMDLIIDYGI